MTQDDKIPGAAADLDQLWTLRDDRQLVRFSMPPVPLEGMPEPLKIIVNFDARHDPGIAGGLS